MRIGITTYLKSSRPGTVMSMTVRAPIGLRSVLLEWGRWRGASRDIFLLGLAMLLAWLGMRAVFGVFL